MSENLLYLLATIASWLGWGFAAWTLVKLVLVWLPGPALDRTGPWGSIAVTGILAAVGLAIGSRLPTITGARSAGIDLPLVWLVMPFSAWIAVVAGVMGTIRGSQALRELPGQPRNSLWKTTAIWLSVCIGFALYYNAGPERIQTLKGSLHLSAATAVGLLVVVVAGMAAMRYAAARAKTRSWSKTLLTHVMLVGGSIIFGLPFAFLLITSFKEDRDMSSPEGIVWVPRVTETVPYWNPKDPLMEGDYKGQRIEGSVISVDAKGVAEVEILRPGSMRGLAVSLNKDTLKVIPKQVDIVTANINGQPIQGKVAEELLDGQKRVIITRPASLAGQEHLFKPAEVEPVRKVGLRWDNYVEALEYLPPETANGLVYLKNTLIIVLMTVIGTVLSSSVVAYAFARMKFPGKELLFGLLLATMMLPGAVTLMPRFLLFRSLGWIDTLYPLWVPAFFASAFNVFLLRQFFKNIPAELEDAARIDGCSPAKTFWSVMLPLVKPALAVIAIWGFMNAWNNFMDPLIYISSPEKMPLSYALQLFQGDRSGEPGLLMAFATMTMIPVLLLFFFAQRYFVEGVTLSGLGGR